MRLSLMFVLGLVMGLVGSLGWALAEEIAAPPTARPDPGAHTSAQPVPLRAPGPAAAVGGAVRAPGEAPADTCAEAPLAARAQQVLVVGLPAVTDPDDPAVDAMLGAGVGGVFLSKANVAEADQVRALVRALRARQDAPLVVATDEEPGRVSSFGELLGRSPSARTLAARDGVPAMRAFAQEMGSSLAAFGIDVNLAPVADLDDGPSGGVIGDRSFSADPATATSYSLAFARGLADGGVAPTVKHFPGHGRSTSDSHRELALVEVGLDELVKTDLVPFAAHIEAGVPLVMTGHVAYGDIDPERPASLSSAAYRLLRDMGFQGVAITDSIGMGAVNLRWPFPEAAVLAIQAGADAVLATDGNQTAVMRDALVAAVESGRLTERRLDEAAARMLALAGADPSELVCDADVDVPTRLLPAAAADAG